MAGAAVRLAAPADEPNGGVESKVAVEKARADFAGAWEITAAQPKGVTKADRTLVFRRT